MELDLIESLKYFTRAAKEGDLPAIHHCGLCHYNGEGTAVDYERAASYFHAGAEEGFLRSMQSLGEMYDRGQGMERDAPQAFEIWLAAAAQGLPAAQFSAGNYYFEARVIGGAEVADPDGKRSQLEERNEKLRQLGQLVKPAQGSFDAKLALLEDINARLAAPGLHDYERNKLDEQKCVLLPLVDQSEDDVSAVQR